MQLFAALKSFDPKMSPSGLLLSRHCNRMLWFLMPVMSLKSLLTSSNKHSRNTRCINQVILNHKGLNVRYSEVTAVKRGRDVSSSSAATFHYSVAMVTWHKPSSRRPQAYSKYVALGQNWALHKTMNLKYLHCSAQKPVHTVRVS